jgi:hypothetical protein
MSGKKVHIAIMRKSWGLSPKILSGEKTIETRWYKNRTSPWNKVVPGDIIYFKDSGEPVTIRADVSRVLQFANLTHSKVEGLLKKYGREDGLGVGEKDLGKYFERFKDKKYCIVIFLEKAKEVRPFQIDKKGFGAMSAWLTTTNLEKIKSETSATQ